MEARKAQAGAEERVRRAREDEGRKKREREEKMKRIVEAEMKKLAEEEDLAKERKREEEKLRCSNVVCIIKTTKLIIYLNCFFGHCSYQIQWNDDRTYNYS